MEASPSRRWPWPSLCHRPARNQSRRIRTSFAIFSHPKADTRLSAVKKLDEADYAPAAEAVAAVLTDPDDRVQAAAIDAELTFFLTERLSSVRVLGVGSCEEPSAAGI